MLIAAAFIAVATVASAPEAIVSAREPAQPVIALGARLMDSTVGVDARFAIPVAARTTFAARVASRGPSGGVEIGGRVTVATYGVFTGAVCVAAVNRYDVSGKTRSGSASAVPGVALSAGLGPVELTAGLGVDVAFFRWEADTYAFHPAEVSLRPSLAAVYRNVFAQVDTEGATLGVAF